MARRGVARETKAVAFSALHAKRIYLYIQVDNLSKNGQGGAFIYTNVSPESLLLFFFMKEEETLSTELFFV